LFLLTRADAKHVAEFRRGAGREVSLYFDAKGRIWNWGEDFMGRFDAGRWDHYEADFKTCWPHVVEDGEGNVYFIAFAPRNTVVYFCRDGQIGRNDGLPANRGGADEIQALPWRDSTAMIVGRWRTNVALLDLKDLTLRQHALDELNLIGRSIQHVSTDSIGNIYLWLTAQGSGESSQEKGSCVRFDVRTGKLIEIPLDWHALGLWEVGKSVLAAKDGSVFLASPEKGLCVYQSGTITKYPWGGMERVSTSKLVEGPDGRVWCVGGGNLFVYDPRLRSPTAQAATEGQPVGAGKSRSEEHTSELQSLS